jgi:dinuclear metal center YbgI/SA1388 family protein
MKLKELIDYTGQYLQVARFRDYCPNGLQVQGREDIKRIVTGVTASMALLEAAEALGADLVLVHHGYFWKNEDARVIGIKHARLKFLLAHDINLAAYHLPLDAHPEVGNNAQLARVLGIHAEGYAGEQGILAYGSLIADIPLVQFANQIAVALGRQPQVIGSGDKIIRHTAWCTGAAQDYIEQAIELGADAFISGEISERTVHVAREAGIAYIAAGHHATERYGIKALGEHLAQHFGLDCHFIDIDNPV